MSLQFTKMHGLGNDFMVIDAINQSVSLTPEKIRQWGDRNFGIGFDQLLIVEKPQRNDVEFNYRIFNTNGSEVEHCGNGSRCFARFVLEKGLTTNRVIPVSTNSGRIILNVDDSDLVTVEMGIPDFDPVKIPLTLEQNMLYQVDLNGSPVEFGAMSIGNPHAMIQVDDVATADVLTLGPSLQQSGVFPRSVNVSFMQILDRGAIKLRVYERGVGETLACGTGACGAVAVGIQNGLLDNSVKVTLPGGDLHITWEGAGHPVFLIGPATTAFEGMIEP